MVRYSYKNQEFIVVSLPGEFMRPRTLAESEKPVVKDGMWTVASENTGISSSDYSLIYYGNIDDISPQHKKHVMAVDGVSDMNPIYISIYKVKPLSDSGRSNWDAMRWWESLPDEDSSRSKSIYVNKYMPELDDIHNLSSELIVELYNKVHE